MIGRTLGLYFAKKFAFSMLAVFGTVFVLIFLLDFIELMRRAGDSSGAASATIATLALFRTPSTAEQIVPFGMLFGAMASYIGLSRKLELVVARAAGISAWQFLLPALLVATLSGVFLVTVYNPFAAALKDRALSIEANVFRRGGQQLGKDVWLRQRSVDGEAIVRAQSYDAAAQTLRGVTFFLLEPNGQFMERVEAPAAALRPGFWRLSNARVVTIEEQPTTHENYLVATNLSADEVQSALGPSGAVSFWSLPEIVSRLELAGLDATRYRLVYQTLLARPALLAAMVLLAACFSLKFLRSGGLAQMVLGGVSSGFALYVATKVAEDLGNAGAVSAAVAAWVAPVVASALSAYTLLGREDG